MGNGGSGSDSFSSAGNSERMIDATGVAEAFAASGIGDSPSKGFDEAFPELVDAVSSLTQEIVGLSVVGKAKTDDNKTNKSSVPDSNNMTDIAPSVKRFNEVKSTLDDGNSIMSDLTDIGKSSMNSNNKIVSTNGFDCVIRSISNNDTTIILMSPDGRMRPAPKNEIKNFKQKFNNFK